MTSLDYEVLRTIKRLTLSFEVRGRPPVEWEQTILAGYDVWRQMRMHEGGVVHLDLRKRTLAYPRT